MSIDPNNSQNDDIGAPISASLATDPPAPSITPIADVPPVPVPSAAHRIPFSTILAAVLGLLAAWMAAGSIGLTGHALRVGLTWLAMGGVLVAALRPGRHRDCPGLRVPWFGNRAAWRISFRMMAVVGGTVVALAMTANRLPTVQVLAVPVLLGVLATTEPGRGRVVLKTAAEAALLLALYRLVVASLPLAWLGADHLGEFMGGLAGRVTGCPLWVGATFAGVDFLIPMLYVAVRTPFAFAGVGGERRRVDVSGAEDDEIPIVAPSRSRLRIWSTAPVIEWASVLLLVIVLHGVFLTVMTFAARWYADLPELPPPDPDNYLYTSPREFVHTVRTLVPWNVFVLAVLMHAMLAAVHWGWWSRRLRRFLTEGGGTNESTGQARWTSPAPRIPWPAAATLAVAFGVAISLGTHPGWRGPAKLDGKKIVLFEKGFLNWMKPVHGDYGSYSIGMYGMLPVFLESLGAECVVSPDLSAGDLKDADALVLIYPNDPWEDGQKERVWEFVRQGGSLLVMGEHTIKEEEKKDGEEDEEEFGDDELDIAERTLEELRAEVLDAEEVDPDEIAPENSDVEELDAEELVEEETDDEEEIKLVDARFNELLEPTAMRVNFDSATFEVGGWLQSYQALAHPITAGMRDAENDYGVVIGASVDAQWPARPLLIGRWGWADPGNEKNRPSLMGNDKYDPGERLGDLVLAAEQPFGRGKVIVFGDTSGLTNGLMTSCYVFKSRLMAYLAESKNRPRGVGMQVLALCVCLGLAVFVAWQREAWLISVAAVACGLVIVFHTDGVHRRGEILPDKSKLVTRYDMSEYSILEAARQAEEAFQEVVPPEELESAEDDEAAAALIQEGLAALPDDVRPFGLAYVDASHLNAYSPEGWRDDGVMGLCLTLMREGYLTLSLPEITAERLEGADLLVTIAPSREYTAAELEMIDQFIRDGGKFIYMIGREHYAAGRPLLEKLQFRVGVIEWDDEGKAEPMPCSHFKVPYPEDDSYPDYLGYVRFHAAWPVARLGDPEARQIIAQRAGLTPEEPVLPLIEMRPIGSGLVVVIGDTAFATNQNLERYDGHPIEGERENADFWRWLLTLVRTGEVLWSPEGGAP